MTNVLQYSSIPFSRPFFTTNRTSLNPILPWSYTVLYVLYDGGMLAWLHLDK